MRLIEIIIVQRLSETRRSSHLLERRQIEIQRFRCAIVNLINDNATFLFVCIRSFLLSLSLLVLYYSIKYNRRIGVLSQ